MTLPILRSGEIAVPAGFTPSGGKFKAAVDNPYITKDDFIQSFEAQGLGLDASIPQYTSGELDRKILQASGWINRHCRRWFDQQTIDETMTGFSVRPYNPRLVTVVMQNRPFTIINSIWIQVLQWFIQVQTTQSGYLQIFPDKGFYKIVPLLSSSGTGLGTPIPAAILDRVPLGVLWTNYTFGYGTPMTGIALSAFGSGSTPAQFQAPQGYRLWAADQTLTVYVDGIATGLAYTVDYPNGIVSFTAGPPGGSVTVDVTTNESVPADIKAACILLVAHLIGQSQANPFGADSMNMQTFSISFGKDSKVEERAKALLEPYVDRRPAILGF